MKRSVFWSLLLIVVIALPLSLALMVYRHSQQTIQSMQKPVYASADESQPLVIPTTEPDDGPGPVVRCAVINGMNITGFWQAVTQQFTRETGIRVKTVTFGEKAIIDKSFRAGGVDLLTMHACDKIINTVADGLATDPQPWARNDLIIVGPSNDPAHIRGLTDAAEAFRRIAGSSSPLVVHASLGAQEVMRAIVDEAQIGFDPTKVTILLEDSGRAVLKIAADRGAYTLIGRIPYRLGRLPNAGLELMVQGDPRLRRPYVVVVANPVSAKDAHIEEARKLAAYLRSAKTQAWIADWGRGMIDDQPVFFPVATTQP